MARPRAWRRSPPGPCDKRVRTRAPRLPLGRRRTRVGSARCGGLSSALACGPGGTVGASSCSVGSHGSMNPGMDAWRPAATLALAGLRLGDLFNALVLMAIQSGHGRRVPGTAPPARRYQSGGVELRVMENIVPLRLQHSPDRPNSKPRELELLGSLLNHATMLEPDDLKGDRWWQLEVAQALK